MLIVHALVQLLQVNVIVSDAYAYKYISLQTRV